MRLIDADALIEQIKTNICKPCKERKDDYNGVRCRACQYGDEIDDIYDAPTIEPDYSCEGCKTPKHICGICMRNYPNIIDHYCTGEAWKEAEEDATD